jgi:hypothetical protein
MNATHNFLFNLENQTKDFSYTIFPVKKINVGKILKLSENRYLIIISIHILKLEISGCDTCLARRRCSRLAARAEVGLASVATARPDLNPADHAIPEGRAPYDGA